MPAKLNLRFLKPTTENRAVTPRQSNRELLSREPRALLSIGSIGEVVKILI
jgi:hypothetical protein